MLQTEKPPRGGLSKFDFVEFKNQLTLLAASERIFAVWDVGPAEDIGLCGIDCETEPLGWSVCRALDNNARQIGHWQGAMD